MKHSVAIAALLLVTSIPARAQDVENVLIVLADDVGVDSLAVYGVGNDLPSTPTIDALAAGGVTFDNAWSTPVCSATRATLVTGRYGFRTGVGHIVTPGTGPALPLSELTIPEMLDEAGSSYRHAAFGKWHLGNQTVGGAASPNLAGWSHYAGSIDNLGSYYTFAKTVDGTVFQKNAYATTDTIDDAIDWIQNAPEPWVCYLALHSAHFPFHAPPSEQHTVNLTDVGPPTVEPRPYYKAMVESLDHELGRLIAGLGPAGARTTVLFVGDNGSPEQAVIPPFIPVQAKGTVFEGGVHVPFIVASADVVQPGRRHAALVHTVDVLATVAELAGIALPGSPPAPLATPGATRGVLGTPYKAPLQRTLDSVSVVPYLWQPLASSRRATMYTEVFQPNGLGPKVKWQRAIRDVRYKLHFSPPASAPSAPAVESFYDLVADPFEQNDLLKGPGLTPEQLTALQKLRADLAALLAS